MKAYADQVVDAYGLRPRIRLNTKVVGGAWDEANHLWRGTLDSGRVVTSRFVVGAVGGLEVPKLPEIEGIETFAGKVVHTAQWDHDYDYAGRKIAVIGTGATALQLIPELAAVAEQLTVFQRRPIWVAPKPDFPIPAIAKDIMVNVGPLHRAIRAAVTLGIDFGYPLRDVVGNRYFPFRHYAFRTLTDTPGRPAVMTTARGVSDGSASL
ncbi:flavin-containing monooxygenase [Nocardia sp. NPDC052566]|uniref:flavin-containing monooxygenase n=1 Tax=Nocardia sp. NPDC052566 TaxID=3364330 RepID=UPI0037C6C95C